MKFQLLKLFKNLQLYVFSGEQKQWKCLRNILNFQIHLELFFFQNGISKEDKNIRTHYIIGSSLFSSLFIHTVNISLAENRPMSKRRVLHMYYPKWMMMHAYIMNHVVSEHGNSTHSAFHVHVHTISMLWMARWHSNDLSRLTVSN